MKSCPPSVRAEWAKCTARDPKLGRDVAIKVLPEAFAGDAARMARFQREAKVLASLRHPNIATIYGLEDSGNTRALIMELVEGPTLADRIKQGPIPSATMILSVRRRESKDGEKCQIP